MVRCMTQSFHMLGKTIRVSFDESTASRILERELGLYPSATASERPDFEIRHSAFETPNTGFVNPATHHDLTDGFSARFGPTTVRWVLEEGALRRIDFHLHPAAATGVRRRIQRMRSNQFTLPDEAIGQIFHELVLIPSVYFDPQQFLLHASGLQAPDGTVTLIGGTGGVGKTSLGLELSRHHGFRFVTDDIAVVDRAGHVWPNLAFPKIYGYNVDGDAELRRLLLRGGGWEDRLNWKLHRRRGADRVRRRVSPADLYSAYSPAGGKLARYFFIARELRDDVVVERSSSTLLAPLSTAIMDAEYHAFHNHLAWHGMNRLLRGVLPVLTRNAVLERWCELASDTLASVDCLVVRVPRTMNHVQFKAAMVELITASGTLV